MKKVFDSVAMKREGALRVQAKLAGMSREEQLAYWQQRGRELDQRIRRAKAAKSAELAETTTD